MGLISKIVITKWNGRNKKWYIDKGYIYTKMNDEFEVKVEDLSKGSEVLVLVQCDGCSEMLEPMTWKAYKKYVHENDFYYCNNCAKKLANSSQNANKTKLREGKNSLGYWLIKKLPLKEAVNILARWDYELNKCDPREIGYCSEGKNKKGYYFKCPKNIHPSELKRIADFTKGNKGTLNCKACNSMAQYLIDIYGENALQDYWDWEKNNELEINPWVISKNSNKKVYIFCQEKSYHGSYFVSCDNFSLNTSKCPYCCNFHGKVHRFDSLGWLYPEIKNIWSEKNKKSPFEYSPFSIQYAWWRCLDGKHNDYKRRISESTKYEFRCPSCVQERDESILQGKVRLFLEALGYEILHEHNCTLVAQNPKSKKGHMPYDNEIRLTNGKHLIIEVHGIQHYQITNFHILSAKKLNTTPEYELHYQQLKDRYKRLIAYKNGYEYLEIPYWTDDKEESWKNLIGKKISKNIKKENINILKEVV